MKTWCNLLFVSVIIVYLTKAWWGINQIRNCCHKWCCDVPLLQINTLLELVIYQNLWIFNIKLSLGIIKNLMIQELCYLKLILQIIGLQLQNRNVYVQKWWYNRGNWLYDRFTTFLFFFSLRFMFWTLTPISSCFERWPQFHHVLNFDPKSTIHKSTNPHDSIIPILNLAFYRWLKSEQP